MSDDFSNGKNRENLEEIIEEIKKNPFPDRFKDMSLEDIISFLNLVDLLLTHYEYRDEKEKKYVASEGFEIMLEEIPKEDGYLRDCPSCGAKNITRNPLGEFYCHKCEWAEGAE